MHAMVALRTATPRTRQKHMYSIQLLSIPIVFIAAEVFVNIGGGEVVDLFRGRIYDMATIREICYNVEHDSSLMSISVKLRISSHCPNENGCESIKGRALSCLPVCEASCAMLK